MKAHRTKFRGMVQDMAYTDIPQDKYFEALNMRILTQGNSSTGAIETELGNSKLFEITTIADVVVRNTTYQLLNFKIVGWTTMRNYVVVFTISDYKIGGEQKEYHGINEIFLLEFDPVTNTIIGTNPGVQLTSSHLKYVGFLNFSINNPIEAYARYEHPTYGKVYWVDGANPYRHFNLLDSESMNKTEDQLDILSNVDEPVITINGTVNGGAYKCGMVQYAAFYYRKYSNTTKFSSCTGLVPLHPTDETEPSRYIIGGEATENTTKAVSLTLSNLDTRYDYIRLYSLYYPYEYSTPEIYLVGEYIVNDSDLNIIDPGDFTKESLTLQEFVYMGSNLYIPYTMDVKDNMMLLMNIKEEPLDIPLEVFDPRAYRFPYSAGPNWSVTVYDDLNQGSPATVTYNSNTGWGTLPGETHSCIIEDQDTTNKYNKAGYIGGSGPNVSYRIRTLDLEADNGTSDMHVSIPQVTQDWESVLGTGYSLNKSFGDYTSIINSQQLVSYQRGETYRFGVVIKDSRGRTSFVSWIGDIRMPDYNEREANGSGNYFGITDSTSGSLRLAYIEFTLDLTSVASYLGTTDFYYQIVRVERKEEDRSVLGVGIALPIQCKDLYDPDNTQLVRWMPCGGLKYRYDTMPTGSSQYANISTLSALFNFSGINSEYSEDCGLFICPETQYIGNIITYQDGDYLHFFGNTDTSSTEDLYNNSTGERRSILFKSSHFKRANTSVNLNLQQAQLVTSNSNTIVDTNNGGPTGYVHYTYNYFNGSPESGLDAVMGYHGSAILFTQDTVANPNSIYAAAFYNKGYNTGELAYAAYRRVLSSQYGGATYADRVNNEYIPCGPIVPYNGSNATTCSVFGGDTFVGYFEYLRTYADLALPFDHISSGNQSMRHIMIFPTETVVNLALTHGERNSNTNKTNKHLIQPIPNSTENPSGDSYNQDKNFYLYNQVYSIGSLTQKYYPRPLVYEDVINQDVKVLVSSKKFLYENIDSFTVFGANSFTELDPAYGPIQRGVNLGEGVVIFQTDAVGVQMINERSITQDQTGSQVVLGEGKTIGQFRYISTTSGTIDKFSVVVGDKGIYYYDSKSKAFKVLASQSGNVDLSLLAGVSKLTKLYGTGKIESPVGSILDTVTYKPKGVVAVYDKVNKRVIFTMLNYYITDGERPSYVSTNLTISYNELTSTFESLHSYKPLLYLPVNDRFIALNPAVTNQGWLSDSGDYGEFFGSFFESYVVAVVNSDPYISKLVSNVMYISDVIDSSGVDYYNLTFTNARVWNGHQNTGEFTLNSSTCRRLGRLWKFAVPKNAVTTSSGSIVYNDRSRLVDSYALIKLGYTNTGKRLILNELICSYYPVKYI